MKNILLRCIIIIGLSFVSANATDIDKGFEYYDKGDFKSAFAIFEQLADGEDAQAQYLMFVMYSKGEYVSKDDTKAVEWAKKSAALGDYGAHLALGTTYLYGIGVKKNIDAAKDWFMIAADEGLAIAMARLASIYEDAHKGELAAKWWEKAAEAGRVDSMYNTALSYCVPSIGKKETDLKKCAFWAKKARENGYDVNRLWKDFELSKYE